MIEIHREEGWTLNPNDKVVNAILKRCEKNKGLCPCVHDSENCPAGSSWFYFLLYLSCSSATFL